MQFLSVFVFVVAAGLMLFGQADYAGQPIMSVLYAGQPIMSVLQAVCVGCVVVFLGVEWREHRRKVAIRNEPKYKKMMKEHLKKKGGKAKQKTNVGPTKADYAEVDEAYFWASIAGSMTSMASAGRSVSESSTSSMLSSGDTDCSGSFGDSGGCSGGD